MWRTYSDSPVSGNVRGPSREASAGVGRCVLPLKRTGYSALLAATLGALCCVALHHRGVPVTRNDFSQIWFAARALASGRDPYAAVALRPGSPWNFPMPYPLPATLVALPLVGLSTDWAPAVFAGFGAALLCFAILWDGLDYRLLALASAPFMYALTLCQWSPALTGAALVPAFGFLFAAKPTVGAACFAYRPTWRAALAAVAMIGLAFVVWPGWFPEWLQTLHSMGHTRSPITQLAGVPVALAALRWRRPEARLLLVMACVPQTPILYEALPLVLVPGSLLEMAAFVALSWGAYAWWSVSGMDSPQLSLRIMLLLFYLPCLVMVLRRPNEGSVPAWLERRFTRLTTA